MIFSVKCTGFSGKSLRHDSPAGKIFILLIIFPSFFLISSMCCIYYGFITVIYSYSLKMEKTGIGQYL